MLHFFFHKTTRPICCIVSYTYKARSLKYFCTHIIKIWFYLFHILQYFAFRELWDKLRSYVRHCSVIEQTGNKSRWKIFRRRRNKSLLIWFNLGELAIFPFMSAGNVSCCPKTKTTKEAETIMFATSEFITLYMQYNGW